MFNPYNIQHLQLNGFKNLIPPRVNSFIVFWWGTIPLGHVWVENHLLSAPIYEFQKAIVDSVWKALTHYLSGTSVFDGLYELLLNEDAEKAASVLETGFCEAANRLPAPIDAPISVVICTRNRPRALWECIKGLMASTDKNFELIVVDNASDNQSTQEVVECFAGVRYIREDRKGLDIARNTGARMATHNIVAYTDDDVYVDKDWITSIKRAFHDPLTMAVTGLVLPLELRTKSQYIFEKDWGFNRGYVPLKFDHSYFMNNVDFGVPVWEIGAGANMAFRKEAFELVGFFDERLDVGASGCSGDSEMWYRILAEGWNCNYVPTAVTYHQHRETKRDLQRQIFYYMRGQVSSLLVQYENYGHQGNMDRIQKGLHEYYSNRIKDFLQGKETARVNTLFSEIRGCISGWKYYHERQNERRTDLVSPCESLSKDVQITDSSRVSVVIPCFNHGQYLEEAILSVLRQTYSHYEIIVVDDGSTDDTNMICDRYREQIRYVRVERVGLSAARNIGVQFSTGDFLVFLDADDILYPNALEINLFYFKEYRWAAFVSGGHDRIDKDGNLLPSKPPVQKIGGNYGALLQGNYIGMEGTVMYRRALFFAFHFDPKLKACEDYDLNLRIARYFSCVSHTVKIAGYRIHTENMSHNKKMMYEMAINVLQQQEKLLTLEEEKINYDLGIQYWTNYYLAEETMPKLY